jgi:hypothetical protein
MHSSDSNSKYGWSICFSIIYLFIYLFIGYLVMLIKQTWIVWTPFWGIWKKPVTSTTAKELQYSLINMREQEKCFNTYKEWHILFADYGLLFIIKYCAKSMLLVIMFKKWYIAEDQTEEGIIDSVTMHVYLLQGILFLGHATVIPSDSDTLSEWKILYFVTYSTWYNLHNTSISIHLPLIYSNI